VIGAIHLDVCACVVAWLRAARAASAVRFIISETSYICDLVFERLAQHFEHVPAEFQHLVQKQHAVMGQTHLARPRLRPAAGKRGVRNGVMGCAKRPIDEKAGARRQQPGDRVHGRNFEGVVERQRRQDRRQPSRYHRLAGTRRTHQQQVVAASRRDFQRSPCQQLPAHISEVEGPRPTNRRRRRWRCLNG
jgi:hypothetical protein